MHLVIVVEGGREVKTKMVKGGDEKVEKLCNITEGEVMLMHSHTILHDFFLSFFWTKLNLPAVPQTQVTLFQLAI